MTIPFRLKSILCLFFFSIILHISPSKAESPSNSTNSPSPPDIINESEIDENNSREDWVRVKRQGVEAIIGIKIKRSISVDVVVRLKIHLRDDNDELRRRRRRSVFLDFPQKPPLHQFNPPNYIQTGFTPLYTHNQPRPNLIQKAEEFLAPPAPLIQNIAQNPLPASTYNAPSYLQAPLPQTYGPSKLDTAYGYPIQNLTTYRNHFGTKTQERFHEVNVNLASAVKYKESFRKDPMLMEDIVLNPTGVNCANLCDDGDPDVTHGLLGICTGKFCKCNIDGVRSRKNYKQEECPVGNVFDPLKLNCDLPHNTVLCSDDLVQRKPKEEEPQNTLHLITPPVECYYVLPNRQPNAIHQKILVPQTVEVLPQIQYLLQEQPPAATTYAV